MNYNAPLLRGGVFAGLGYAPRTFRYHDSSIYKNNGTLAGYVNDNGADSPNKQWKFDPYLGRQTLGWSQAAGQSVRISTASAPTYPLTLTAWIKKNSSLSGSSSLDGILSWGNPGQGPYVGATIQLFGASGPTYKLAGTLGSNTGIGSDDRRTLATTAYAITTQWCHVAGIFRAFDDITLYVNGVSYAGDWTGTAASAGFVSGGVVGILRDSLEFGGLIADPCVFPRVLSPSEIACLADPTNVMLSCGGVDAILPPFRKWWVIGGGGAPAAKPWLYRRRNQVIGAGL
ncbi:MAG: hypothetical protein IMZ57_04100 [Acidobacteria bacterium]|nr:hypothetical protein [Acidobacteriota bacterium]